MPKFANFVQCSLVGAISAGATSIQVEAEAPFNLPPNPAGQTAYVTIMDDLNSPTLFEIVGYTGVTVIDATSLELTGCTRGQHGTTALPWGDEGFTVFVRQDVTSDFLESVDVSRNSFSFLVASKDTNVYLVNERVSISSTLDELNSELAGAYAISSQEIYAVAATGQSTNTLVKTNVEGGIVWQESIAVAGHRNMGIIANGNFAASEGGQLNVYDQTNGSLVTSAPIGFVSDGIFTMKTGVVIAYQKDDGVSNGKVAVLTSSGLKISSFTTAQMGGITAVDDGIYGTDDIIISHQSSVNTIEVFDVFGEQLGIDTTSMTGLTFTSISELFLLKEGSLTKLLVNEFNHEADNNRYAIASVIGTKPLDISMSQQSDGQSGSGNAVLDASEKVFVEIRRGGSDVPDVVLASQFNGGALLSVGFFNAPNTASIVNGDTLLGRSGDVVFNNGFEWVRKRLSVDDIAGNEPIETQKSFAERNTPPTPPSGTCYVYMDALDGAFKVKFSNGVVKTIATP